MNIVIFLFDGITALDAIGPYESLARIAATQILFVAREAGPVRTGDGFLALHADAGIDDVAAADLLIVPGGHRRGLAAVMADPASLAWIARIDATTRRTCSVCTGSLILGAAGLLAGRSAATHWRAKAALARHGASYSATRVAIDGKYVTSAGVSAGIDMGLALCRELAGDTIAQAIELSMHYDPQPPMGTGDPECFASPERIRLIETVLRQ